MTSVTTALNKISDSYGGSSKTSPSFLRLEHVKFNSISKAKDLGSVDNLNVVITGNIGSESGTNTLYFKVLSQGTADIRITKNPINKHTDKYVSIGVLNENKKPIPLTGDGFAYRNDLVNTTVNENLLQLSPGIFYFTITSSQWQSVPYSVNLEVIRYVQLYGTAIGSDSSYGRLPLLKGYGTATLSNASYATFPAPAIIKALVGSGGGLKDSYGLMIINSVGTAEGRFEPYGRMVMVHRISSATSELTSSNYATLTVSSPGGGY